MSKERDLLKVCLDSDCLFGWLKTETIELLESPEKQPLATFTVKDGKVIGYTLTNGELPNGDYDIYAKEDKK